MADRLELSVAVYAEQQRTERARTPALPGSPSADDAVHRAERLHLHPRGRARAGLIGGVEALGDDPLEPLLLRGLEERDARSDEALAAADRAHRRERLVKSAEPFAERLSREVLAIRVEEIEDLVDDRRGSPELADRRVVRHVHAWLQPLKAGNALFVERDDLAVDDRLVRAGHRFGDLRALGILPRAIEEVARLEAHLASIDEGDGAHAVPLRLVRELGRVERLVGRCREHRRDLPEQWIVLRRRAVLDHQPVAAFVLTRFHKHPFALQAFSVEPQLELVVLFLERHVRTGVPYRHRSRAVAIGDRKSTRLNSSHTVISYAVFCLKKKKNTKDII